MRRDARGRFIKENNTLTCLPGLSINLGTFSKIELSNGQEYIELDKDKIFNFLKDNFKVTR